MTSSARTAPADHGPRDVPAAVAATRVSKVYGRHAARVHALGGPERDGHPPPGVTVAFDSGKLTAVMGESGSGKSTLMHCLAGLDTVTGGTVHLAGVDITRLPDRRLTMLRRERVGFVFQTFNLLPTLSARRNIQLPLRLAGREPDRPWFDQVVAAVGLGDRLDHRPSELSGGQQQRVACARALVTRPEVIFADEPTGNLDSLSSSEVLGFLRTSVREMGQTVVLVTHDPVAASHADRVVFLHDGELAGELTGPTPESVLDALKRLEVR